MLRKAMMLLLLLGQAIWAHSHLGILSCTKLCNAKLLLSRLKGGADSTILLSILQVNSKLLFTSHDAIA